MLSEWINNLFGRTTVNPYILHFDFIFIHSLIYFPHILIFYYLPGPCLSTGETTLNKAGKVTALMSLQPSETDKQLVDCDLPTVVTSRRKSRVEGYENEWP